MSEYNSNIGENGSQRDWDADFRTSQRRSVDPSRRARPSGSSAGSDSRTRSQGARRAAGPSDSARSGAGRSTAGRTGNRTTYDGRTGAQRMVSEREEHAARNTRGTAADRTSVRNSQRPSARGSKRATAQPARTRRAANGSHASRDGHVANGNRSGRSGAHNVATKDAQRDNFGYKKAQKNLRAEYRSRRNLKQGFIGIGVIALVVFLIGFWWVNRPITVTVNDTTVQLKSEKIADTAVAASGLNLTPGNLIDVEGEILEEGGGTPYTLTINGEPVDDGETKLHNGDELIVDDGTDVEEESTVDNNHAIPFDSVEEGDGPIYIVSQQGKKGVAVVKTGNVSGKSVVLEVTKEPQNRVYLRYYPDVGSDKVICLTFDDGPYTEQTGEVLDILKANDAKATFFVIGEQLTGEAGDMALRAHNEGHELATHTWDHAAGSGNGVDLGLMSEEEQRDEIQKGMQAINDLVGENQLPVMRAPGGNFELPVWQNVDDLVVAQITWTIDTADWSLPGSGYIASQIESAGPGDIILMHDGGGDRSQTIAALEEALPHLKEQGYQFITCEEMLEYPPLT